MKIKSKNLRLTALFVFAFVVGCASTPSATTSATSAKTMIQVTKGKVTASGVIFPIPDGFTEVEEHKGATGDPAYIGITMQGDKKAFKEFTGRMVKFYQGKMIANRKIKKFDFGSETFVESRNCANEMEESKGVQINIIHRKDEMLLYIYAPMCSVSV